MGTIYSCQTCGLTTTKKGHLCNQVVAEKAVVCKLCGMMSADPRHVCAPGVVNLKYVCSSCGRLAPKRDLLCHPSALAKPKKAQKKKAVIKVVSKKAR